ncbi:MAG: hypothetical protein Q4F84_05750, partial [Fibrobacter sp.]|nr:hypothetical protein [Fibrobacter sp.]
MAFGTLIIKTFVVSSSLLLMDRRAHRHCLIVLAQSASRYCRHDLKRFYMVRRAHTTHAIAHCSSAAPVCGRVEPLVFIGI